MVTRAPAKFLVPLVVFTVFFTGCTQLFGAKLSLALNINLGDSPMATYVFERRLTYRSAGLSQPFAVISSPPDEGSILSQPHFDASCALAKSLSSIEGVVPQSLQGIAFDVAYADGGKITCISVTEAKRRLDTDAYYLRRFRALTNVTARADLITFVPGFNPFGSRTELFVSAVREVH